MEACDDSWSPRSNATALAGFALTTTTTKVVALACLQILLTALLAYLWPRGKSQAPHFSVRMPEATSES